MGAGRDDHAVVVFLGWTHSLMQQPYGVLLVMTHVYGLPTTAGMAVGAPCRADTQPARWYGSLLIKDGVSAFAMGPS